MKVKFYPPTVDAQSCKGGPKASCLAPPEPPPPPTHSLQKGK